MHRSLALGILGYARFQLRVPGASQEAWRFGLLLIVVQGNARARDRRAQGSPWARILANSPGLSLGSMAILWPFPGLHGNPNLLKLLACFLDQA